MKKVFYSMIAAILVIATICSLAVPAFAAGEEEYISELRLVYAEDYDEAKAIIAEGEFKEYKVLNENLNENSGEIGVWLAYKTTTNIEEAITDLAVMQMNGGYSDGNYQEMIKQSYDEYVAMGQIYLDAINYFVEAYDAGDYLADAAFRQLNFYNIVSDGIPEDEIPTFEGERLGDIFYEGIDEYELATIFFQGNSYVLDNVRLLLAMGVSYNEDGKTYLDKVGDAAAQVTEDPTVFVDASEDLDMYAALIAPSIGVFADMFKELETVEEELDYMDEDYTDQEQEYLEYYSIAQLMRRVNYLDDKTLYQFCMDYVLNEEDYSALYPLAYALNEGQQAMTKVFHYYDVVRYSVSGYSEEALDQAISDMEEEYSETPFNVYEGVDRTIYYGTFALTSAAERADAYTEENTLTNAFFGEGNKASFFINIGTMAAGAAIFYSGSVYYGYATEQARDAAWKALDKAFDNQLNAVDNLGSKTAKFFSYDDAGLHQTYDDMANDLMGRYAQGTDYSWMGLEDKLKYLNQELGSKGASTKYLDGNIDLNNLNKMNREAARALESAKSKTAEAKAQTTAYSASTGAKIFSGMLYVAGGVMMLYSAYNLIMTVYNYYHPDYEDIPLAMVDLINTIDGDRYIKYDVVLEAETNDKGEYSAADLNAFEAQRWNALYYTKSYEAGKPLLADAFVLSNTNNQPKEGYTPVHRFGEQICYDLNKYNFDGDTNIYLSVKQSKNDKFAAAGVPEVVGSMFGVGFLFLAGGVGVALGVGGTFATQSIIKKKKAKVA